MDYFSVCYACGSILANFTVYREQKTSVGHFPDIFSLCVCVCMCVCVFFSFKNFLSGKYNVIYCLLLSVGGELLTLSRINITQSCNITVPQGSNIATCKQYVVV
jgi:hypothetical protein